MNMMLRVASPFGKGLGVSSVVVAQYQERERYFYPWR